MNIPHAVLKPEDYTHMVVIDNKGNSYNKFLDELCVENIKIKGYFFLQNITNKIEK